MLPASRERGTPAPGEMIGDQYSESASEQISNANNLHTSECPFLELVHTVRGRWRDINLSTARQ